MAVGLAVYALLISLLGYALSDPGVMPDCRKFVFAPICRGVAAKRSSQVQIPNYVIDANNLKEFLNSYSKSDWPNTMLNSDVTRKSRRQRVQEATADLAPDYD